MRRTLPIAGLVCLLLAMFPVWTAVAQTPEAEPEPPFVPWQVTDIREFEVEGEPVALSPDGRWIAGIGPGGDAICVWDVETFEPLCAGAGLRVQAHPITGGIAWAPDSSAVAFINGNWRLLEPTDVMLFDIERGWLRNLTQTAARDRLLVHTGPAWTADSTRVVYAQTDPSETEGQPASIISYDRRFDVAVPISLEDAFYIYAPVRVLPDDSVLFRIDTAPVGTGNAGIWRVDPDGGNMRQVLAGEDAAPIERPVVLAVSPTGAYLTVASEAAIALQAFGEAFFLVEVASGEVTPIALEDGEVVSQPVLGEAARFLLVQDGAGIGVSLLVMEPGTGETQRLEDVSLAEPWLQRPATWAASGTVLIPAGNGGALLRLETGVSSDRE